VGGRRRQAWTANECVCALDALDVRRVEPFGASLDLELDFLSLGEGFEPVHHDRREVHKHVLAAFLFNEAVALRIIEPLHFPSGHASCLLRGEPSPHLCAGQTDPGLRPLYRRSMQICQENAMSRNDIPYQTRP